MTYSRIYFAKEDGDLNEGQYAEVRNSWGFGFFIFDTLSKKFSKELSDVVLDEKKQREAGPFVDWWKLWQWVGHTQGTPSVDLDGDPPKLPAYMMNTLVAGYDGAYIQSAEHILRLADSFDRFVEVHWHSEQVQNLSAMAKIMREAVKNGAEYACFYPMSVSEDHWMIYEDGDDDEGRRPSFKNESDMAKVRHFRYLMAPLDGGYVSINDVCETRDVEEEGEEE